ncbi:STAS domain-containing protein [Geodermatophilus nigrescens]
MSDTGSYFTASPTGTITVASDGAVRVLLLAGEIDNAVVADYRATTASATDTGVTVVDASRVTFINSSGLSLLMEQTKAGRDSGQRIELRGASRRMRQLLEMTGLETYFTLTTPPPDAAGRQ